MPTTSPDNIYMQDPLLPFDPVSHSILQAVSVQNALNLRERFSFVWANQAEREAQQYMITGSTGYQLDTKSEYKYEGNTWRLATPHMEFYSSVAIANSAVYNLGTFTVDTTASTSSTMAAPGGNGIILISDPGIYAVGTVTKMLSSAATGRTFLDLTKVSLGADQQRVSLTVGEDTGSISKPNVRITVANSPLYFQMYRTVDVPSNNVNTRVAITRIG
jgi:hypothetical protein